MSKTEEQQGIVQLDWADIDGSVTVTPENEDRFNLKIRRAIEACKEAVDADQFGLQFRILLKRLAEWRASRTDVQDAYVTVRDGRFVFLVVRNRPEYDAEFEDSLSALDLAIANDTDLERIHLDAMAVPPASRESLASFLNPSILLVYRGK